MKVLMSIDDARLEASETSLRVCGRVNFDGAAEMAEAGREWLEARQQGESVRLDLGDVEQVSSAALSVMLEWLRAIREAGLRLDGVELSPALQRLTRLAGIDSLLPATVSN